MLTTPMLQVIRTFDAKEDQRIVFETIGSKQVAANRLVIERISDGAEVYNAIQETYALRHTIPANTLVNGVNYRAKIKTRARDANNVWQESVNFSASVRFWCFSQPRFVVEPIDYENFSRVNSGTVMFETTYIQDEGEILESFRYSLYDANKNLIRTYDNQFADGSEPLRQEMTNLNHQQAYFLRVVTLSPNGNRGTTGYVYFTPWFIAPRLSIALETEILPEQGAIIAEANILQIRMQLYDDNGELIHPTNVEYIDNSWLDLTRVDYDKLVADSGFNIAGSDFYLQLWIKNIPEGKVFLTLFGQDGRIELFKIGNRMRVYKYGTVRKQPMYYCSNAVNFVEDAEYTIHIRHEQQIIDLFVQAI